MGFAIFNSHCPALVCYNMLLFSTSSISRLLYFIDFGHYYGHISADKFIHNYHFASASPQACLKFLFSTAVSGISLSMNCRQPHVSWSHRINILDAWSDFMTYIAFICAWDNIDVTRRQWKCRMNTIISIYRHLITILHYISYYNFMPMLTSPLGIVMISITGNALLPLHLITAWWDNIGLLDAHAISFHAPNISRLLAHEAMILLGTWYLKFHMDMMLLE